MDTDTVDTAEAQVARAALWETPAQKAISAFARRVSLSDAQRAEFIKVLGGPIMTVAAAWKIVRAYGSGQMPEFGSAITKLTKAWLTLGRVTFDLIFRLFRATAGIGRTLKRFGRRLPRLLRFSQHELQMKVQQLWSLVSSKVEMGPKFIPDWKPKWVHA